MRLPLPLPRRRRPAPIAAPRNPVRHRACIAATTAAASLATAATLPPPLGMALIATAWSSSILTISGMEAWVKFRAPLLAADRAAAVDAGRHVFGALLAAEAGLAAGLSMAVVRGVKAGWWVRAPLAAALPVAVVAADALALFPALDARARHAIAASTVPANDARRAAVADAAASVAGREKPPAALHGAYIAGEAAKVACLAALAGRACTKMSDLLRVAV